MDKLPPGNKKFELYAKKQTGKPGKVEGKMKCPECGKEMPCKDHMK